MFFSTSLLRKLLLRSLDIRHSQGYDTNAATDELLAMPDSYDALYTFAASLSGLPFRAGWSYVEPDELEAIESEYDAVRAIETLGPVENGFGRARTAFLGSVCGCILGKPLEFNPTLAQIRALLEPLGAWPLDDYPSRAILKHGALEVPMWNRTYREDIVFVMPDDDLNYSVLGLIILEEQGLNFTRADVRVTWLHHLCATATYGPERIEFALSSLRHAISEWNLGESEINEWTEWLQLKGDVLCGAQIRADAYGYAAAGNPSLAAQLAWRDAGLTHQKTGLYASMWTAAAIATAFVESDRLQIFRIALQYVPQRSRFFEQVSTALTEVEKATDWLDGYERINARWGQYGHCQVFQECGLLINTLRWAENVGDGICKQVMQGADTDSYGATAGSILGAYFGPDGFENRWLTPFNDDFRTALTWFHERSLQKVADRMGNLPRLADS